MPKRLPPNNLPWPENMAYDALFRPTVASRSKNAINAAASISRTAKYTSHCQRWVSTSPRGLT